MRIENVSYRKYRARNHLDHHSGGSRKRAKKQAQEGAKEQVGKDLTRYD